MKKKTKIKKLVKINRNISNKINFSLDRLTDFIQHYVMITVNRGQKGAAGEEVTTINMKYC